MKSHLILRKEKKGKKPSAIRITLQLAEAAQLLEALKDVELTDIEQSLEQHIERQVRIYEEQSGQLIY